MRLNYEYLEEGIEQLKIPLREKEKSWLSEFFQSIKSFGPEQQVHTTINALKPEMLQSVRSELSTKWYDLLALQNDNFVKNTLMREFILSRNKQKPIDENTIKLILPRLSDPKRTTINERRSLQYFLLEKWYFKWIYTTPNAYQICDGMVGDKTKQALQKYLQIAKKNMSSSSFIKIQSNTNNESLVSFASSKKYLTFLNQLETQHNLPKNFLYAMMIVESGGKIIKNNVNKGLFQINQSIRQKEISLKDSLDPVKSAQRVSQKLTTEFNVFKKPSLTYPDLVNVLAAFNQWSTKTRNNGSLLTASNKINIQNFEKLNNITFNHILRVFTILGKMNNTDYLSQLGVKNTNNNKIKQGIVLAQGKLDEVYQGKSLAQTLQSVSNNIV